MLSSQLITSTFPKIPISFLANTSVLTVVFVIFSILYILVSAALVYHWSEYGMHSGKVLLAEFVFVAVTIVFFTIAVIALISF